MAISGFCRCPKVHRCLKNQGLLMPNMSQRFFPVGLNDRLGFSPILSNTRGYVLQYHWFSVLLETYFLRFVSPAVLNKIFSKTKYFFKHSNRNMNLVYIEIIQTLVKFHICYGYLSFLWVPESP